MKRGATVATVNLTQQNGRDTKEASRESANLGNHKKSTRCKVEMASTGNAHGYIMAKKQVQSATEEQMIVKLVGKEE